MNGASAAPPPLPPPRRVWRSTGAIVAGIVVVVVLSLGIDQILHAQGLPAREYPVGIVLTGLPCAWLGGVLYGNRQS